MWALLRLDFVNDGAKYEIREYRIDRKDVIKDIELLITKETEFWGHVVRKQAPYLVIQ